MLIDEGDFHVSALILGPDDTTVLIREQLRNDPLWKFPGGKKKLTKPFGRNRRGESPIEALIREVHEETGIWLKKKWITYIHTENRGHYNQHFFLAQIPSFRGLKALSDEYEETRVFPLDQLMWLSDFHPVYRTCFEHHMKPALASLRAEQ